MNDSVSLALIVAVGALLTIVLNGWMLTRSKRADYARQDQVAAAAEAREQRQVERAKAADAAAAIVDGKLNQIHELVNSTLTESMEDQLLALQQLLVALTEIIRMHRANGVDPSVDMLAAESATRRRVAELQAKLADRARQTADADAKRVEAKTH